MDMLIKNIEIVNSYGIQNNTDIYLLDGKIEKIGKDLHVATQTIIDGSGLYAFPGFCDLHCHLRDPGLEYKEDIVSGTLSAAAGGFTTVCAMPNTKPPVDNKTLVEYVAKKAKEEGSIEVLPVACITKGMRGDKLTDFKKLISAGAIAFSDDGMPVEEDEIIKAAMQKAKECDALLMLHEEDLEARGKGVAHEGEVSKKLGLEGIARSVEERLTARDLYYAGQIGAKIHVCHVSTKGSVELIRRAKAQGINVTCETGPHYFSLTDAEIYTNKANAKVNPPLREETDRLAIIAGIEDGTIDAIATDHAPHSEEEKKLEFALAPFGLIGFETAFALAITYLYKKKAVGLPGIAKLMSSKPREIINIGGGAIEEGVEANIAICDIDSSYIYKKEDVVSKAKNSPYIDKKLYGKVIYTILGGKIVYDR